MENKPEKRIRKFEGVVVSDKMDKTIVVRVDRLKKDEKYIKYHRMSTKLKAHDEGNIYKVGDKVVIEETRPLSKEKRWIATGKIV